MNWKFNIAIKLRYSPPYFPSGWTVSVKVPESNTCNILNQSFKVIFVAIGLLRGLEAKPGVKQPKLICF